jgi:hypothetical protein
MECYEAQAIISEALDGCPPDARTLDAAKQHCRECRECATFVRALNLVKRAPLPVPPADLPDRVMAAVRREAAAEQARAEFAAASLAASGIGEAVGGGPDASAPGDTGATARGPEAEVIVFRAGGNVIGATGVDSAAPDRLQAAVDRAAKLPHVDRRPRPIGVAAWIGAAAVLLVSVGAITVLGIRTMSQELPATSTRMVVGAVEGQNDAGNAVPEAAAPAEGAASSTATSANVPAGPNYITVGGFAYRLVGPSKLQKSQFTRVGTAQTSLSGGVPRARDVLGTTGAPAVYVEDDQGALFEFLPAERTFEGRTYRLRSAEISAFGTWPTLPTDLTPPIAADGSPTFSPAGTDSSGVAVFRRASFTIAEGIGIAPGAPPADPGGGNPNWTWWGPAP